MASAIERMRLLRASTTAVRAAATTAPTTATAPVSFLTSSTALEWASPSEPSKSWADVALDEPPVVASTAPVRESASTRLQRMRDASAAKRAIDALSSSSTASTALSSSSFSSSSSSSSSSSRSTAASRMAAFVAVAPSSARSFAERVQLAASTTGSVPLVAFQTSQDAADRLRANQLDRAAKKRRRSAARAKEADAKAKRSAAVSARRDRAVAREAAKQASAQLRVDAASAAKRKRDELHADGRQTPGELLADLQRRKLFVRLVGWKDKKGEPPNEPLRRRRIALLRAVLGQFGAISALRFDFEHGSAFATFADAAGTDAALEQLSTSERRALALRNAAQALAFEPSPLEADSFVLKRALYLKRSKAHKKARVASKQQPAAKAASEQTPED